MLKIYFDNIISFDFYFDRHSLSFCIILSVHIKRTILIEIYIVNYSTYRPFENYNLCVHYQNYIKAFDIILAKSIVKINATFLKQKSEYFSFYSFYSKKSRNLCSIFKVLTQQCPNWRCKEFWPGKLPN